MAPTREEEKQQQRLALAKANKIEYDIVRSTSAIRPGRIIPLPPRREMITAPSEGRTDRPQSETASQAGMSHNKHCANCGGDGHLLANCVTAEHGSIWVCVFCKTSDHFTDACPSFKKLGLAAKVKLLVTDRAGKPQLSTHRCWCRFLHDFLVSEETKHLPAPTAFPWRITFAEGLFKAKTIHQIQEELDTTQDASKLPKDLEMQGLKDVYSRHWNIEELPWPRPPSTFSDYEE
ncbi:hypothetical protein FMUND_13618 [Fusarium mundagurra]|uniref:CCHC-type domain-containing protein n=1 Tax=Fusarium mundagurra TaxID=1567541 RepID=A0A8H5XY24_9HYPO|nr:hypothetical protein FMUND_13618 [Fusarium mundagurra]